MKALDRWLGGSLVLVSLLIAATAKSYTVGFLVDPLGPRALPYLVAGLLLMGGLVLLFFPEDGGNLGEGDQPGEGGEPGEGSEPGVDKWAWRPQLLCVLGLLGYAAALPYLGFVVGTALATAFLSRVFSGRFLFGLGVGLALGFGLFSLFSWGFGMELPLGLLWGGRL
jgi:putative tricarboxylic transport membrane protein